MFKDDDKKTQRINSENTYIYHITHISNLKKIFEKNKLLSDKQISGDNESPVNIGHRHIKSRRQSIVVPHPFLRSATLSDFVPFYFCTCSPMLFAIHNGNVEGYDQGQKNIVYLVSTVQQVAKNENIKWCFTNGHPVTSGVKFFYKLSDLNMLNWESINAKYYLNNIKIEKQAEFLVHSSFPLGLMIGIGVYSNEEKERVREIAKDYIATERFENVVKVKSEWYFKNFPH